MAEKENNEREREREISERMKRSATLTDYCVHQYIYILYTESMMA